MATSDYGTITINWFEEARKKYEPKWKKALADMMRADLLYNGEAKKESKAMKVSYKGVTGELLKLETNPDWMGGGFVRLNEAIGKTEDHTHALRRSYSLVISDAEDGHKHSFENVDISDVKFIGATVTMG